MLSFVLFLCVLYLVAVFGVTLPYWYEAGNSPAGDIPTPSWSFRPVVKLWLSAAWSALLLSIALLFDPIVRRVRSSKKDAGTGDLPPVLLVHGLYHNPTGWMYLRRHLLKAGFRDILTVKYSSWKTDIATVTGLLESAVKNSESLYPGRKPLLVGHSLGGLLIRNWLADKDNQERALGAVTLGAPHRGSKLAALAFGALGKSLHPDNPFWADLAGKEANAGIPCVSLVSEGDTMVLPLQNLVPVTNGWDMRLTPYATHVGMLTRGAVMRTVVWELHKIASAANHAAETARETSAEQPPADTNDSLSATPATDPAQNGATETTPPAPNQAGKKRR